MEIKKTDDGKTGVFCVELDGTKKAEMTYKHSGDHQITIIHTEVNDALQGQGVGHQLIREAVGYLRENNFKAVAQCSFVKSVFDKKSEEFADIMA